MVNAFQTDPRKLVMNVKYIFGKDMGRTAIRGTGNGF